MSLCVGCRWQNTNICSKCPYKPGEKAKVSKYRNKKTRIDGIIFDSKKEAEFYQDLRWQVEQGLIKGFCIQPKFILTEGNDELQATKYVADFIIFKNDGTFEIVDTKGIETDVFKLKHKMFRLKYPGLELEVV